MFKSIGLPGQKGDCVQPAPMIGLPGLKGDQGPAGLPGMRFYI